MLLMVYAILALAFFFLPERAGPKQERRPGRPGSMQPSTLAPDEFDGRSVERSADDRLGQIRQTVTRCLRFGAASSCSSL